MLKGILFNIPNRNQSNNNQIGSRLRQNQEEEKGQRMQFEKLDDIQSKFSKNQHSRNASIMREQQLFD